MKFIGNQNGIVGIGEWSENNELRESAKSEVFFSAASSFYYEPTEEQVEKEKPHYCENLMISKKSVQKINHEEQGYQCKVCEIA